MKRLAIAVCAVSMLAACAEGPSRNVWTGAAAGAILGAGAGTLAGGDDGRNAAIGAAVGAIAGAAVGDYMDKQERALREQTAGTGIGVERQGDQIALTMPSSITFDFDSATIKPDFYATLNDVTSTLVEYPSTAVDVVGYASSEGKAEYNLDLSKRRAVSVQNYLIGQGVAPVRLKATGMGIANPIADNSTEEGRRANRRVEIILTPVTS
ncbi:OmpA family protein [Hyphomonas sp.]|uniref:OmpA family protein n=1 Tax=Hyphomonas sp. TaxID=87 RepID=UPI0035292030